MLNANHSKFAISVAEACWAKSLSGDCRPTVTGEKVAFPVHAAAKAAFDKIVGALLSAEALALVGDQGLSTSLVEERVEPSDGAQRQGGTYVANEKKLVDGKVISVTVTLIRKSNRMFDTVMTRCSIIVFR